MVILLPRQEGAPTGMQSALDPASTDAARIAELWWWMLAVSTAVVVAVLALLAVALWRGRRGGQPTSPRPAWSMVLVGGVAAPLVASVAVVVHSIQIGHAIVAAPREPAVTVDVIGRRWWWEVRYQDDGGRTIATTANEIHLPVGRPALLRLHSDNVIHSFWVPNLQGKADMVPGQVNDLWLEPRQTGIFRGQCAEFCGTQHAFMAFVVVVEPEDDFRAWLRREAAPAASPESPLEARGRDVFLAGSCRACHTIRGTTATGRTGPDLTHLASRRTLAAATIPNTVGHLGGWIADPQSVKPGALMPPTPLPPEDLRALLAYLRTLR